MGLSDLLKVAIDVKNKAVQQFLQDCRQNKGKAMQKLADETQKKLNKELGLVFESRAFVKQETNSIVIEMKSKI